MYVVRVTSLPVAVEKKISDNHSQKELDAAISAAQKELSIQKFQVLVVAEKDVENLKQTSQWVQACEPEKKEKK